MYEYEYFGEVLSWGENRYISYGIKVVGGSQGISDVSTNEAIVKEIVRKLNEKQVAPVHMADVIYDELH